MTTTSNPGLLLKSAIKAEIDRRGIQYKEAAKELGITRGYLARLMCKSGKLPSRDHRLRKIAEFLAVPVETVYRMIGIIKASDDQTPPNIEHELEASFRRMQHNCSWSAYVPSLDEWSNLPEKSKLFMSRMFEKISYCDYLQRTSVGRGSHPPRLLKK